MIKVKDCSFGNTGNNRVLCVERAEDNEKLAFWPERAPSESVWITPDDAAELAVEIAAWAVSHGGKVYNPNVRNLNGFMMYSGKVWASGQITK